jgi:hypothetical protein
MPTLQGDSDRRAAGGERALGARVKVRREGHRAHRPVHGDRCGETRAVELGAQERQIELHVVSHEHPPGEQVRKVRRDRLEPRRREDVGGPDAVDVLRSHVPLGIQQRDPLGLELPLGVQQHHRDLDDTMPLLR